MNLRITVIINDQCTISNLHDILIINFYFMYSLDLMTILNILTLEIKESYKTVHYHL